MFAWPLMRASTSATLPLNSTSGSTLLWTRLINSKTKTQTSHCYPERFLLVTGYCWQVPLFKTTFLSFGLYSISWCPKFSLATRISSNGSTLERIKERRKVVSPNQMKMRTLTLKLKRKTSSWLRVCTQSCVPSFWGGLKPTLLTSFQIRLRSLSILECLPCSLISMRSSSKLNLSSMKGLSRILDNYSTSLCRYGFKWLKDL